MIETVIVGVTSGGLAGSLALLWRAKAQNQKDSGDGARAVSEGAATLVQSVIKDMENTKAEAAQVRTQLADTRTQLADTLNELALVRIECRGLLGELSEYRRRYGPLRPAGT